MKSPIATCVLIVLAGILPAIGKAPDPSPIEILGGKAASELLKPGSGKVLAIELQTLVEAESFAPSVDLSREVHSYVKVFSALASDALTEKWDWNSPRSTALQAVFSAFFFKLDSVIEEDYKWQPAFANVPPQVSIAANQIKNLKNSQQRDLTETRTIMVVLARGLLVLAKEQGIERKTSVEAIAPAGKSKEMLLELMARTGFK